MAAEKAQTNLKIEVKTPDGKVDGSVELPAELFDAPFLPVYDINLPEKATGPYPVHPVYF